MSDSDWVRKSFDQVGIIAGIFFCAVVLVLLLSWGIQLQTKSERDSEDRRSDYAASTYTPAKKSCSGKVTPDKYDCLSKAEEAKKENERKERDLIAQETTAGWTFIMSAAALSGVILSVVGIGLVWVTFHETRKMNIIAKEIGDEQIAASNAAIEIARDANRMASSQFRAGFKPWITVELVGPLIHNDGRYINPIAMFSEGEESRLIGLSATTIISCISDIPATIEDFSINIMEGHQWPFCHAPKPQLIHEIDFFSIIPSKSKIKIPTFENLNVTSCIGNSVRPFGYIMLTPENRVQFLMNPPPIFGKVIYSDPMGIRYEHKFAFRLNSPLDSDFKRYGGREYNCEREIHEGDHVSGPSLGAFAT